MARAGDVVLGGDAEGGGYSLGGGGGVFVEEGGFLGRLRGQILQNGPAEYTAIAAGSSLLGGSAEGSAMVSWSRAMLAFGADRLDSDPVGRNTLLKYMEDLDDYLKG